MRSPKKAPDSRTARPQGQARAGRGRTSGGVDVKGSTKRELMDQARRLGVEGRSSMNKDELGRAVSRAAAKATTRKAAAKATIRKAAAKARPGKTAAKARPRKTASKATTRKAAAGPRRR